MTTRDSLLLEHRLSELELEVSRLRREVQLSTTVPAQTPAPRYSKPQPRTTIHQTKHYEFFAKLPDVRTVVDFFSLNKATNEVVHIGNFSAAQIAYALQKFSRLQAPSRKFWKGNRWLYSVALRLFAQQGAIKQHPGSRVWHWDQWPPQRRECAARIMAALSREK